MTHEAVEVDVQKALKEMNHGLNLSLKIRIDIPNFQ
jgi:hypothetical protein